MRRIDVLKAQLMGSRGRFFTAEFMLNRVDSIRIRQNLRVNKIISVDSRYIVAEIGYWSKSSGEYVRNLQVHFPVDKTGDCTYLACDNSKFNMEGLIT